MTASLGVSDAHCTRSQSDSTLAVVVGAAGVGKTAVLMHTLQQQAKSGTLLPHTLTFSAQTTSAATQGMIEASLEKRQKNR